MAAEPTYSMVISTTDSAGEADALAKALVERRLAACVQRTPIVSHYVWDGEATTADEILLLIKTRSDRLDEIRSFIDEHHSYDSPELIELPIVSGLPGYLAWIDEWVG